MDRMAASKEDYKEEDIINREKMIIDQFIKYLGDNDLLIV